MVSGMFHFGHLCFKQWEIHTIGLESKGTLINRAISGRTILECAFPISLIW